MKAIVGFIILLIILGAIASLILFIYYNNDEEEIIDTSINYLIRVSNEDKEQLAIPYYILYNDTIIYQGNTNKKSWEEVNISENISQFNVFFVDDEYYTGKAIGIKGTKSIDFTNLRKIGNLNIKYTSLNNKNNCSDITFMTDENFNELGFCALWSYNILEVYAENTLFGIPLNTKEKCEDYGYKWIDSSVECNLACRLNISSPNITSSRCSQEFYGLTFPSRLKNRVSKCWWIKKDVTKNNNLTTEICYKFINNINEDSYIKLFVFDADRNYNNRYILEDSNYNDIGAPDYEFIIK